MQTKTIKLLVFLTFLVHGIGHIQGVIAGLGVKFNESNSTISWLIKGLGEDTNRYLCLALYLGAAIGGILTAMSFVGVLVPEGIWQTMALITAVFSTLSLVLFPNALAMFFNKVGAVLVNLIIYYSILFNGNWPSEVFED